MFRLLFNSAEFLLFFPIVVLVYFVLPHRIKWVWLLVTSYYFYMCWNPTYSLLIATSTVITYLSGLLIEKHHQHKKLWVALSFTSNLAILFFFKYYHFAASNLNALLGAMNVRSALPSFDILLPVGISFYTFQALGYTVDVYRRKISAQKNLFKYALFISFFPQLVAGPIERSGNLMKQLDERHSFDWDQVRQGLLIMLWGFVEKVVIADRAAIIVNQVYQHPERYGSLALILATLAFALQIYCDFSGYSRIAIGAAHVMGFRLMENFRQPYFATSISDFWRRWHISLSTWFKDYLYIPLGGNRCSRLKKYRNLLTTFLVSGLWHGASWNFVIWGALHGVFQIVGDFTAPYRKKLLSLFHVNQETFVHRLWQRLITFALVCFGWIFFRASHVSDAFAIIGGIFGSNQFGGLDALGLNMANIIVLLLCVVLLFAVSLMRDRGIRPLYWLLTQKLPLRWAICLGLIFLLLIFGVYGEHYDASSFIYFQF